MRTAQEIWLGFLEKDQSWSASAIEAINAARKEAIEECAERAKIKDVLGINLNADILEEKIVDKQSILNLINELK